MTLVIHHYTEIIFSSSVATGLVCQVIYKAFESCIDGHRSMTLLIINYILLIELHFTEVKKF